MQPTQVKTAPNLSHSSSANDQRRGSYPNPTKGGGFVASLIAGIQNFFVDVETSLGVRKYQDRGGASYAPGGNDALNINAQTTPPAALNGDPENPELKGHFSQNDPTFRFVGIGANVTGKDNHAFNPKVAQLPKHIQPTKEILTRGQFSFAPGIQSPGPAQRGKKLLTDAQQGGAPGGGGAGGGAGTGGGSGAGGAGGGLGTQVTFARRN